MESFESFLGICKFKVNLEACRVTDYLVLLNYLHTQGFIQMSLWKDSYICNFSIHSYLLTVVVIRNGK